MSSQVVSFLFVATLGGGGATGCGRSTTEDVPLGRASSALESERGALRVGTFHYVPTSDGDREIAPRPLVAAGAMVDGGLPPPRLARGSRFAIRFDPPAGAAPFRLEPASPLFFRPDGDAFVAELAGHGAILANNDALVDFVHIAVRDIRELRIAADRPLGASLHVGDAVSFHVEATDAQRFPLAGTLPLTWSATQVDIITFTPPSPAGSLLRAVAAAPGRTTIVARAEPHEARIEVEVLR
jgi:hypothetical protein